MPSIHSQGDLRVAISWLRKLRQTQAMGNPEFPALFSNELVIRMDGLEHLLLGSACLKHETSSAHYAEEHEKC